MKCAHCNDEGFYLIEGSNEVQWCNCAANTTHNQKEDVMFDIEKCNINVGGRQCRRNRKSGCTLMINKEIIYTCQQHYEMMCDAVENGFETSVKVYHFTGITPVVNQNTQEKIMNSKDMKYFNALEESIQEHFGASLDQLVLEITTTTESKEDTMNTNAKWYELELEGGIRTLPLPRHITVEEAVRCNPYIDFDKLTRGINHAYGRHFVLGQASMVQNTSADPAYNNSKPGYVFVGSDYQGYVGHDGEKFVMVFDSTLSTLTRVTPMSEFKVAKQTTGNKYGVPANIHFTVKVDGQGRTWINEWHKTRDLADARAKVLAKDSIVRNALNGHGCHLSYIFAS